ncbi:hypothetical protein ASG90_08540 [Nocardioides sp. Soil797]|nr:hypothetical protein ASG90_08540 [Nocardioides sp. Soil797]
MTQTDQQLDRIERSIDIDATADKVWDLIRRPGWWINEGEVDPDVEVRKDGDDDLLIHPRFGEFRLRTLVVDAPRRLVYRWIDGEDEPGTRVEFTIDSRSRGGVTLTVVETGFTLLGKSHDDVVKHVEGNTAGWESELDAARRFVTGEAA